MNDLHNTIRFSQTLHFVDATCLLDIQSKISKIDETLNKDLKELSFWLNANKISLKTSLQKQKLYSSKLKTYPMTES